MNSHPHRLRRLVLALAMLGAVSANAGEPGGAPGLKLVRTGGEISLLAGKPGGDVRHSSRLVKASQLFPGQGIAQLAAGAVHQDSDVDGLLDAGEIIDFSYTLVNLGDVALSGLTLTDLAGAVTCPQTTLAVGAHMVCTRSYAIDAQNAADGGVINEVEALGQDASANAVQSFDLVLVQNLGGSAGLRVFKSPRVLNDADADQLVTTGDLMRYDFVVRNSGGEALSAVGLSEPDPSRIDTPIACAVTSLGGQAFAGNGTGQLASGDTVLCSAEYTVRDADETLGQVLNLVEASATAPIAGLLNATGSSAITAGAPDCGGFATVRGRIWRDDNRDGIQQLPGETGLASLISLLPIGADPQQTRLQATDAAGDYEFLQVPIGQVEVRVPDSYLGNVLNLFAVSGNSALLDLAECDVVDADFGYAPPQAGVVGDFVWFDQDGSQNVNEFFDSNDDGQLTLNSGEVDLADFEWIDLNANGVPDSGEFNRCGLVGVPVRLHDGQGALVGEQLTDIRGAYFFADLPLGEAYTASLDPDDPRVFPPVQAMAATGLCKPYVPPPPAAKSGPVGCGNTVPLQRTSPVLTAQAAVVDTLDFGLFCGTAADGSIALDKTIFAGDPYQQAGDVIDYRYAVTNTGPISLAGPVTVSDDRTAVTCPSLATVGDGDLVFDVGETLVCTASYVVSLADVQAGSVTNTAQAFAGGVASNTDTATAQGPAPLPVPVIGVSKRVDALSGRNPYQLRYEILVRNYGVVPLSDLQVEEDLRATFPLPVQFQVDAVDVTGTAVANPGFDGESDTGMFDPAQSTLAVDDEIRILLTLTVEPGSLRGPFFNTVVASGRGPNDVVVTDNSVTSSVPDPDGNGIPDEADPTPVIFPSSLPPAVPTPHMIPLANPLALAMMALMLGLLGWRAGTRR